MITARAHNHRFAAARLVTVACTAALALGCSITEPSGRTTELDELSRNRQLWATAQLHDYEFDYRRSCYCTSDTTEPVHITVRGDVISSVARTRDGVPVNDRFVTWPRVDELFADVQRQLEQGAARIEVVYDPTYGYPRSIVVDVLLMAIDDEMEQRASNLRALP